MRPRFCTRPISVRMKTIRKLPQPLSMTARGGRLLLLAVRPREDVISPTVLSGERSVQTIANFRLDEFPTSIELLEEGAVRTDGMVTHKFRLDDALEAFRVAEDREHSGAIKVLVIP